MDHYREPWKDAEDYYNDNYGWIEKRPICDCCKEHIRDDYYYEIDGEKICFDCIDKWLEQFKVPTEPED